MTLSIENSKFGSLLMNRSEWKRFAPGMFARSIPKAIGKRSSGSKPLTIARYTSTPMMTYIISVFMRRDESS